MKNHDQTIKKTWCYHVYKSAGRNGRYFVDLYRGGPIYSYETLQDAASVLHWLDLIPENTVAALLNA